MLLIFDFKFLMLFVCSWNVNLSSFLFFLVIIGWNPSEFSNFSWYAESIDLIVRTVFGGLFVEQVLYCEYFAELNKSLNHYLLQMILIYLGRESCRAVWAILSSTCGWGFCKELIRGLALNNAILCFCSCVLTVIRPPRLSSFGVNIVDLDLSSMLCFSCCKSVSHVISWNDSNNFYFEPICFNFPC